MTQIPSVLEWRTQPKGVLFEFNWEDIPFIVKTTSVIGSEHEIFFEVADTAGSSFARVVVRLSRTPIYYVESCQNDTLLEDLPEDPDNVRIWKFIKHRFIGLSIECNGALVAELKFDEAGSGCSKWKTTEVKFLQLNPKWDNTVAVWSYKSGTNRHSTENTRPYSFTLMRSFMIGKTCGLNSHCYRMFSLIVHLSTLSDDIFDKNLKINLTWSVQYNESREKYLFFQNM